MLYIYITQAQKRFRNASDLQRSYHNGFVLFVKAKFMNKKIAWRNCKILKFQNSPVKFWEIPKFQSSKIPTFLSSKIPKFRNSKIPKFQNSKKNSKFSGNCKIPKFRNSEIPKFQKNPINFLEIPKFQKGIDYWNSKKLTGFFWNFGILELWNFGILEFPKILLDFFGILDTERLVLGGGG